MTLINRKKVISQIDLNCSKFKYKNTKKAPSHEHLKLWNLAVKSVEFNGPVSDWAKLTVLLWELFFFTKLFIFVKCYEPNMNEFVYMN